MRILLMMAMTLDGIVARTVAQNANWTSRADKREFIAETKKHGVIILGQTTYEVIGRPLPGRLNFILSLEPEKFKDREIPGTLEFFKGEPEKIKKHLGARGFKTAILGGGPHTNSCFLKAGLVDEILITVEPKLFGNGMTFAKGNDLDINLELIEIKPIGDDAIHLRYKVLNK